MASELGSDVLPATSGADIVLFGEVHDNPDHHLNQARAVAEWGPRALVFEMLSPEQVAAAADVGRGDAAALEAGLGWADSGWPDFSLYYPIFAAAPSARIYGAAVPTEEIRRAMIDGAAAVYGDDAILPSLPFEEQREREAGQLSAHCDALPADMLTGMVEAQRLRDAWLAQTAARALTETGGLVVVITGNGHARKDWGMPVYLARLVPDARVLSIGQFEAAPDGVPPFDHWLVTARTEREDPCEAFR
ncbi:MAG: ChaN family lipoprotein [Pseudomonadota bacterium]